MRMATMGVIVPMSDKAAATINSDMDVVRDRWCAEIVLIRNYFTDCSET